MIIRHIAQYPPACRYDIIVLDNASTDVSAETISARAPEVQLIASDHNLGFAAGDNTAAIKVSGRRLLLLNPDTLVLPGSLTALWDFAEAEPQARIWGGRTLFADGSLNRASCWGEMSLWSLMCSTFGLTWRAPRTQLFNPEAFGNWPRDTIRQVDIVSGCFLMIDHDLWRALGGFDPLFFMYAEEADLCIRARAHGARPMVTPAATIIHHGGRSEANAVDKVMKIHRGRVTLIRRHWHGPKRAAGLTLYWLWALLRLMGARVTRGPRDDPTHARDKWKTIWRNRHIWLGGYQKNGGDPKATAA